MGACMDFPKNPEDFLKSYSFKDRKEEYTNGDMLIQTFRVEQMIEHYFGKPKEYEDLEEQGLLLKLPCKVGSTVYVIKERPSQNQNCIVDYQVMSYRVNFKGKWTINGLHWNEFGTEPGIISEESIGKTAFLDLSKAEAKLKELEESNER